MPHPINVGDIIRTTETGEVMLVVARAGKDPDTREDFVECLGINLYAIQIGGQTVEQAVEHDNRAWYSIADVEPVRPSGIAPAPCAAWSRPHRSFARGAEPSPGFSATRANEDGGR